MSYLDNKDAADDPKPANQLDLIHLDAKEWTIDMGRRLHTWLGKVRNLLNGRLTLRNLRSHRVSKIVWNSDTAPVVVECPFDGAPDTIICVHAVRIDAGTVISNLPVSWTWDGTSGVGQVSVTSVGSLLSSVDYEIDLVMLEA